MPRILAGTFHAKSWTETPFHELEGAGKLGRASIVNAYQGDLEAEGTLEYLLAYPAVAGGEVPFLGLERVVGRMGGEEGSLVLRHEGAYSPVDGVRGTLNLVPGSATGAFSGLGGAGILSAKAGEHGGTYRLELSPAAA